MMTLRAKPRQSGYSIVEIAYVLTAISLVVTGAVWGFTTTIRNDQTKGEREQMLAMHEAILAYAANNRTFGTEIDFVDTASGSPAGDPATIVLPSGRPMLPCPDLDGDGLEDRNKPIGAYLTVTIEYQSAPNGEYPPLVNFDETTGRCLDSKGHLPWRTLGVSRPSDHWGNLYTYWVDENFSHGLFGFDQITRGNYAFKHLAVPLDEASGYAYAVREFPKRISGYRQTYGTRGRADDFPSRWSFPHNGAVIHIMERPYDLEPTLNSPRLPYGTSNNQIVVAGELLLHNYLNRMEQVEERVANHPGNIKVPVFEFRGLQTDSARVNFLDNTYSTNVMANGIAFALVSHGPNGHGAAKYKINHPRLSRYDCTGFPEFSANAVLETNIHAGELLNAIRTFDCTLDQLRSNPSCGANVPGPSTQITNTNITLLRTCNNVDASNGIFVSGQETTFGEGVIPYFDDIVTWMHPDELVQALTERDVLPLALPPVALPSNLAPYDYKDNSFI